MQTVTVRARMPGIAGGNHQYRTTGEVFEIELAEGAELPAWVEKVEPVPPAG